MARSAFVFGTGTLTSRILGLIRDVLVNSILPMDMRDAWTAAIKLPNFFRRLFGEGGLSVSFIPVYVGLSEKGQVDRAQALANGLFTLLLSLALLITGLLWVYMDSLIPLWLSGKGFTEVQGKMDLTILMARLMVPFLFFITLFAYFMAILNSHRRFALTGFAPLFLNVSIIVVLWFYKDHSRLLAPASCLAVVLGGFLQAFFLLPGLWQLGQIPQPSLRIFTRDVKTVLVKFVPTFFGVGVLQVLSLVNAYFASNVRGGVNYFYVSDRLLELPLSLIAVSIGTTLLPTLSKHWSEKSLESFLEVLARQLSLFYFLAIPSAFGLWFLGTDIISILFKRGEFLASDVEVVSGIIKIYCLTLLAAGSLKILTQSLYAIGDTLTPALISAAGVLIHIFLAPFLMSLYSLNGLALSTALMTLLNGGLCVYFIHRRIDILPWKEIGKNISQCALAASVMGSGLYGLTYVTWRTGTAFDFLSLVVLVAVAAGLYFGMASFLGVKQLDAVMKRLRKRS
jgi:putative peptidoglycan lipid II flippase